MGLYRQSLFLEGVDKVRQSQARESISTGAVDQELNLSYLRHFQKVIEVVVHTGVVGYGNTGKQFDDARQAWIYVSNRMFQSVTGWAYFNMGKEINRFGIIGHPRNPFELAPSRSFNSNVSFKPSSKLQNDLELRTYTMWLDWGDEKIRGQKIIRNTFAYQFSRNLFIRLIGEYNWVDYYDVSIENMVHQKYFSFEPLMSYKLNALSMFYLGAHWGARTNFYMNWDDLHLNSQSVYLKFQYLFRP